MEELTVLLELTHRCNLSCGHCYNKSSPHSNLELSLDEILQIIKDIKEIEQKFKIGRIILTGGEFLFMKKAKEVFSLFRKEFSNTILRIETNGLMLLKNRDLLKDFSIDELYLSIDRFHGNLNDDGSSAVLEEVLNQISPEKLIVRNTISTDEENIRELFKEKYGMCGAKIEYKYVSPSGRGGELNTEFKGFHFKENPSLFDCQADNIIFMNVRKEWYACYTACSLSYTCNSCDPNIAQKTYACGLVLDNGMELLLHIGIDTVEMQGDGFEYLIKEGQEVKAGTPLIRFNRQKIKEAGYSDVTVCVITDGADEKTVHFHTGIYAQENETVIIEIE